MPQPVLGDPQLREDVRIGIDRVQAGSLADAARHLLGAQSRERKHGPIVFVPLFDFKFRTAVKLKCLGSGD